MIKRLKVSWTEYHEEHIEADPENDNILNLVDIDIDKPNFKSCNLMDVDVLGDVEYDPSDDNKQEKIDKYS